MSNELVHLQTAMDLGYSGGIPYIIWNNYLDRENWEFWTAKTAEYFLNDAELLPLLPHLRRVAFSETQERNLEIQRFWRIAEELGFSKENLLEPREHAWGRRLPFWILPELKEFDAMAEEFWGNDPMFSMWIPERRLFRQSEALAYCPYFGNGMADLVPGVRFGVKYRCIRSEFSPERSKLSKLRVNLVFE